MDGNPIDRPCVLCGAPAGIPCSWHARIVGEELPHEREIRESRERAEASLEALDGAMDRLGLPV